MDSARLPMSALMPTENGKQFAPTPAAKNEWTALPEAPSQASAEDLRHFKLGNPVEWWEYKTPDDKIAGYVCRWNTPKDNDPAAKEFRQLAWCRNGDGAKAWRWQWMAKPRPLYGVEILRQRPSDPVLVVEGERTADAARRIAPGYVVITWPGGASNVPDEGWDQLRGRDVVIWPDADVPGQKAAHKIAGFLPGSRVVTPPEGTERGWDLSDGADQGWEAKNVADHIAKFSACPASLSSPASEYLPTEGEACLAQHSTLPPWEDVAQSIANPKPLPETLIDGLYPSGEPHLCGTRDAGSMGG